MLTEKLLAVIEDIKDENIFVDKFIKNFTLADCLFLISEAWNNIEANGIRATFSKAGF